MKIKIKKKKKRNDKHSPLLQLERNEKLQERIFECLKI